MKEFNTTKWRQFIIEEAALTEADFGNDIEDRYAYVRPLLQTLPDTERVDFLVRGLDDGRMMDDKMEFDYYFVELMKLLGREDELMEEMNPEADEIDAEDLEAAAEFFDGLDEELFTPNEMSAMAIEKEMQEGKGIPDVNTDFSVGTDFSDDLSENDVSLDEIINEAKPNLKKALPKIAARNVERNNNINFDIEEMMDMVGEAGKDENSKEAKILFKASNASSDLEQALVDLQAYFEKD